MQVVPTGTPRVQFALCTDTGLFLFINRRNPSAYLRSKTQELAGKSYESVSLNSKYTFYRLTGVLFAKSHSQKLMSQLFCLSQQQRFFILNISCLFVNILLLKVVSVSCKSHRRTELQRNVAVAFTSYQGSCLLFCFSFVQHLPEF